MTHDLISFPNARISLTSIHAIVTEPSEPGVVYVDYGNGNRIGFEGDVEDVMKLIDAFVESRMSYSVVDG